MTVKQFIEKAIEGGWQVEGYGDVSGHIVSVNETYGFTISNNKRRPYGAKIEGAIQIIFLDPKAWEAVGKVVIQAQDGDPRKGNVTRRTVRIKYWAKNKMLQMIDAICDGKSISDYIKTL